MDRPRRVPPRLDRTARLLGAEAMEKLGRAPVVVLGVGGVGTFAAEALVRAGVGRVTLVDGERIEETNANRQLHALDGAFGRWKAEEMAERLRRIRPDAHVDAACERYAEETAERLVPPGASFVVDAMDTVVAKLHVVRRCLELGIPIVEPTAVHQIGLVVPPREPMTPLTAALVAEARLLAEALR